MTDCVSSFKKIKSLFCSTIILLRIEVEIHSSESAFDRVFSALSRVTSTEMCNVTPLALNARLVVKFDSIFGRSLWKTQWKPSSYIAIQCLGIQSNFFRLKSISWSWLEKRLSYLQKTINFVYSIYYNLNDLLIDISLFVWKLVYK